MCLIKSITRELQCGKKTNYMSGGSHGATCNPIRCHTIHCYNCNVKKTNLLRHGLVIIARSRVVTCNPIRCHTTKQVSQSCYSEQFRPWHQICLTCMKGTPSNTLISTCTAHLYIDVKFVWEITETSFDQEKISCKIPPITPTSHGKCQLYLLSPRKSVDTKSSSV